MRDLLFKNLTSDDRKRRILSSSEIVDKEGVRNIICRHFVCIVKEINPALIAEGEVKDDQMPKPLPYLYMLKKHDNKEKKEKFFCRIKGSLYAVNQGRLFLIHFMHSLKITLMPIPQDLKT